MRVCGCNRPRVSVSWDARKFLDRDAWPECFGSLWLAWQARCIFRGRCSSLAGSGTVSWRAQRFCTVTCNKIWWRRSMSALILCLRQHGRFPQHHDQRPDCVARQSTPRRLRLDQHSTQRPQQHPECNRNSTRTAKPELAKLIALCFAVRAPCARTVTSTFDHSNSTLPLLSIL